MIVIKTMEPHHWNEVRRIYEEGLSTGNATFQTSAPEWEEWDKAHIESSRLIALDNGQMVGWTALTPVSSRCVYGGVAEVSIYVADSARGKGVGKILLKELIASSEAGNFWTLQAGVFPENIASIKIHEASGFRVIGKREKIGRMDGIWRDTILLERRSKTVGL
jgi:L-amino acid N-acyltransferase YncA